MAIEQHQLSGEFQRFVGVAIPTVNDPFTIGGRIYDNFVATPEGEKIIEDLQAVAGETARVVGPTDMVTLDHKPYRMNIRLEQGENNTWVVPSYYTLG